MERIARGRILQAMIAGADASMAIVSTVLAAAQIGDRVVSVMNVSDGAASANVSASFEAVITVLGAIQQIATDLSMSATLIVTLQRGL